MGFKFEFLRILLFILPLTVAIDTWCDFDAPVVLSEGMRCEKKDIIITIEKNPLAKAEGQSPQVRFSDKTTFEIHCNKGKVVAIVPKSRFSWGSLTFEANSKIVHGKDGLVVRPEKNRVIFSGRTIENVTLVDLSFVILFEVSAVPGSLRLADITHDKKNPFLFKGVLQEDSNQCGNGLSIIPKGSEVQWLGHAIDTIRLGRDVSFFTDYRLQDSSKPFVAPSGSVYRMGRPYAFIELSRPISMYGLQLPKSTRVYFGRERLFFIFSEPLADGVMKFEVGVPYEFNPEIGKVAEAQNVAVQSSCFNACDGGYVLYKAQRTSSGDKFVRTESIGEAGALISVVGSKGGSIAYYQTLELTCTSPKIFSSCSLTEVYRLDNPSIGEVLGYFSNPYSVSDVQKLNLRKAQKRKDIIDGILPHKFRYLFEKDYKWKVDFADGFAYKEPDSYNDGRKERDEDDTDEDGKVVEVKNNFDEIKGYDKKSGFIKSKMTSVEQDKELLKIRSEAFVFYISGRDFVHVSYDRENGNFAYRITVDGMKGYLSNGMKEFVSRNPNVIANYQFHSIYNDNTKEKEDTCEHMDGCH